MLKGLVFKDCGVGVDPAVQPTADSGHRDRTCHLGSSVEGFPKP